MLIAGLCGLSLALQAAESSAAQTDGRRVSRLLATLPAEVCDTPDAMCLLPNGDLMLSVPNVQDQTKPSCLIKVTRGHQVIVSNMDMPFGPSVNKRHTLPATLSVIDLGPAGK